MMRALARKSAAFCVLDTHAGVGRYDLSSGPAMRTGEWQDGIGRLLEDTPPALVDYVGLVRMLGLYPGSPVIARTLMRPQDRMICCELHPEDAGQLRRMFARDAQVAVHHRDAWEALPALLPPQQKRALVLIDPPYEQGDEFAKLSAALLAGWTRFRGGVFAAWYPIKHRTPVREFHAALQSSGIRDIVAAELWLREPVDPTRLNGCGLAVVNPPFGFLDAAPEILGALLDRLGTRAAGEGLNVIRLVDE